MNEKIDLDDLDDLIENFNKESKLFEDHLDLLLSVNEFNYVIIDLFERYNNCIESLEYGASFINDDREKLHFYWGSLISGVFAASDNLIRGIIIALVENDKSCEIINKNYTELSPTLKYIFPKASLNNKKLFISKIKKATLNNPLKFVEIFEKILEIPVPSVDEIFKNHEKWLALRNDFMHHGGGDNKGEATKELFQKILEAQVKVFDYFYSKIQEKQKHHIAESERKLPCANDGSET